MKWFSRAANPTPPPVGSKPSSAIRSAASSSRVHLIGVKSLVGEQHQRLHPKSFPLPPLAEPLRVCTCYYHGNRYRQTFKKEKKKPQSTSKNSAPAINSTLESSQSKEKSRQS